MRTGKIIAGAAFSALFLYLAFRAVRPEDLGEAFRQMNYLYTAPAALLILASLWLRAYRWRFILLPVKRIRIASLFRATCVGTMVNTVFPARLGELVRAHMIGKREGISRSVSFATVVGERVLDGLALLLFLMIPLFSGSLYAPGWLGEAGAFAAAGYAIAITFLIFLKGRRVAATRFAAAALRFVPERTRMRLVAATGSFVDGLGIFRGSKSMIVSALLSPVVWLPNVATVYLLLAATGIHVSVPVSFLLLVALCVIVIVPAAPGYLGTVQFVCVGILGLFGVPPGRALTFSIIYGACVFVPIVLAGIGCLVAEGLSFREVRSIIRMEK
jgi:hypothetical protein